MGGCHAFRKEKARSCADTMQTQFRTKVQPIVKKYCVSCHSGANPDGNLSLDKTFSAADVTKDLRLWERLLFNVKSQSMPPSDPKPSDAERQLLVDFPR